MDVVQDDHQAALVGRTAQRLGHVVEDPEPVLGRLDVASEDSVGVHFERSEHLTPRPERRRTLGLDTAPPPDGGAAGEGNPSHLQGQSGLADTRFPGAQDEPTSAAAGALEPPLQRVELAPSPDDAVAHDLDRISRRRVHATGPPRSGRLAMARRSLSRTRGW